MLDTRPFVRPALLLTALALLVSGSCVAAYHDGLPTWTPPADRTEGSIGYHRLFCPESAIAASGTQHPEFEPGSLNRQWPPMPG